MTEVSYFATTLPRFSRALVIEKGRDGAYAVAVSRNGRVLFLSERPLGELAGHEVVLAVRPWLRAGGGTRRVRGKSVLVRTRPPVARAVIPASAVVAAVEPPGALAVLDLSPRGLLALVAADG